MFHPLRGREALGMDDLFCHHILINTKIMSITSFLNKLKYGSYKDSSKASVYEEIAKTYNVQPQHVYEIAHGRRPQTREENDIFQELLSKGIIVNRFV